MLKEIVVPAKIDSFPVTYRHFIMTQEQIPLELHESPETYFKILYLSARKAYLFPKEIAW